MKSEESGNHDLYSTEQEHPKNLNIVKIIMLNDQKKILT